MFNLEGAIERLCTFKRGKEKDKFGGPCINRKVEIWGVAQLGEHLPCKQGVRSSILLISTTGRRRRKRRPDAETNMGFVAQGKLERTPDKREVGGSSPSAHQ